MTAGGAVRLEELGKSFGGVAVVRGIDLDIPAGEFFSLLGASGCGKTTTLRMIAGFEQPDTGRILLDGRDLSNAPPHHRPVNTVFQSYALFPFLDVTDNVAFGLKYQKLDRAETARRVGRALELTRMAEYAHRRPAQLSGGQQQRVALARALVLEPRVLLLDEPLGALDAQLRRQLQLELRALQREVGITFIYVTHDQEEALTMSDRIAVLADGRVEQVGAPEDIYAAPATTYVAAFLGSANIFDADVLTTEGDTATCTVLDATLSARADVALTPGPAAVVIRPERIALLDADARAPDGHNVLRGTVHDVVYLGAATHVHITLSQDAVLTVEVANSEGPSSVRFAPGESVQCVCAPDAVRLLRRSAAVAVADPAASLAG